MLEVAKQIEPLLDFEGTDLGIFSDENASRSPLRLTRTEGIRANGVSNVLG